MRRCSILRILLASSFTLSSSPPSYPLSRNLSSAQRHRRSFAGSSEAMRNSCSAPRESADCVVIGAGVVGLAVARQLAIAGRDVLVLDSAPTFGPGTSSRNSEVIHAGIYYPRGSLKAEFCVRGRELLYKYCSQHKIPHKQIGKLIVATGPSEVPKLTDIMNRGIQNGVYGLRLMDGSEATRMEPELWCEKAVFSPVTGIINTHSLMLTLMGEAENHGTTFSFNTVVTGAHIEENSIHLRISDTKYLESCNEKIPPNPDLILVPKFVVNSAGLSAPLLAKRIHGLDMQVVPPTYFARGCYFTLSSTKKSPFERLIYPLPEDGGIGVHVTLDLNGQVKFGPDVEWINGVDDVSSFLNSRAERFYPAIRKYYPNLKDGSLEPGYAGIRPKLSGPQQSPKDFVVQGEDIHGISGLVSLFGIESPGLTSSMAIAEYVVSRYLNVQ
ncbi:hypothetical protein CDL15_Pgr001239 [Punica granatum]|uniref:L-2-hydroxyglutarate dehydrogenase, mitochondrial n=1 Tax=Punica granatum TaxID=22663 RepID=A0A218WK00_PUNGR|nr:hypothetical protein CDL15_Pgr001239 [Punica granatum]